MKLKQPIKLKEIASFVNAKIIGDPDMEITGINEIHKVEEGDLTYVDFHKYYNMALESAASIIIIDKMVECPDGKALLVSDDPFTAYNSLTLKLRPFKSAIQSISESAQIGPGAIIQPNVFIGNHVKIGKNCIIHPNVTIYDYSEIGDNTIIHANTVIGSDAFYFKGREEGHYEKMHTVGRAIIEDDVEIGSCCTIDSGVSGDTIIGEGSKIDNLVHIGHGTVIGKNCLMAAQVAIAGKTHIGNNVKIYGKCGISKDLVVGDNAIILASSNVSKSLEGGKTYFGTPAVEAKQAWKELAMLRHLPEIWEKLKATT
ncbi:MAG: UDP-3-O-(3-hydroxymyristoyl)glucosamine N-acyltransferase [Chitinophagales bacterium]|nr:UDP-3-O-(3-hydroxymyristoyl)glucosamine N-acyltransferase [Chitinophagales bacterium]